ncbi:MAG: sulfur-oxidizing protein SoxZ [Candidatus Azotimanducaceae bacterium]|jgi:sulfur-oxidizing protein SoxZ
MEARKVKMRGKIKNTVAQIKVLMEHPMETGTRRDEAGDVIPAHFIQEVICQRNDEVVLSVEWGTSISKNPYFAFKINGANPGDVVKVSWTDNLGETSAGDITLK